MIPPGSGGRFGRRARMLFGALALVTVGVSAFVGPGCGTMMNHAGIDGRSKPIPYGGIMVDVAGMVEKPSTIPLWVLDFPFSFVADTLCLPNDIIEQFPHDHTHPAVKGPVGRPKSGEKSSSPAR